MNCPDCGADLSEQTVVDDGVLRCAACGRIIHTEATETKSHIHQNQPHEVDSRFQISEKLGEGSFGLVFKAYDRELQRFVAIKQPKVSQAIQFNRELFLREARAASRLRHPNIVSVFDVIQKEEKTWIVSEWIDGTSLRDWLEIESPSLERCCEITIKLCEAVEHAHRAGVIHRDIKPANVVMDSEGQPHLLDFGLSHSRTLHLASLGGEGQPIGTPAFMAPEQVRGERGNIDRTTDVYALGVVLYQLITKSLPFRGRSSELYQKILDTQPPPPRSLNSNIPASLEAICLKAMQKQSAQRYATANELALDLNRFLNGEVVQAYGKLDQRTIKRMVRRRFMAGVAATLGAAAAGTTWILYQREREANPYRSVRISVTPSDAKIQFEMLSPTTGLVTPENKIEARNDETVRLPPGIYKVSVSKADEHFFVYRTVPAEGDSFPVSDSGLTLNHESWTLENGTVVLPAIQLIPMSQLKGKMSFQAGGTLKPIRAIGLYANETFEVPSFLMDTTEVSRVEFKSIFPEFHGDQQSPNGSIVEVSFRHALAYAEAVGKQIPSAWDLTWATTNGNQTKYPWGEAVTDMDWPEQHTVGDFVDQNQATPPIFGLFSGPLEWADTPPPKLPVNIPGRTPHPLTNRTVFGGPLTFERASPTGSQLTPKNDPMTFGFKSTSTSHVRLGFRCVRYLSNP